MLINLNELIPVCINNFIVFMKEYGCTELAFSI